MGEASEPLTLSLWGSVPSKKNSYRPRKGGKGFYKDDKLQAELDYLTLQIPAEMRGLKLQHPDMTFRFTVAKGATRRDRDNMCQTLIDVLVSAGVLWDDSISQCNGRIIIEPAVVGDQFHTIVELVPKEGL